MTQSEFVSARNRLQKAREKWRKGGDYPCFKLLQSAFNVSNRILLNKSTIILLKKLQPIQLVVVRTDFNRIGRTSTEIAEKQ